MLGLKLNHVSKGGHRGQRSALLKATLFDEYIHIIWLRHSHNI